MIPMPWGQKMDNDLPRCGAGVLKVFEDPSGCDSEPQDFGQTLFKGRGDGDGWGLLTHPVSIPSFATVKQDG